MNLYIPQDYIFLVDSMKIGRQQDNIFIYPLVFQIAKPEFGGPNSLRGGGFVTTRRWGVDINE